MLKPSCARLVVLASIGLFHLAASVLPAIAAIEMHMVPVLSQPVARGDIIHDSHIVLLETKRSPAGIDYITEREALAGMAAKRPLRAGVPLRITDITEPKIIKKGDLVNIAFETPGLSLSIRGKALEDGVHGQSIRVMNTQTNRAFEGVAAAAGYVLVPPQVGPSPVAPDTSRLEYSSPTASVNNQ